LLDGSVHFPKKNREQGPGGFSVAPRRLAGPAMGRQKLPAPLMPTTPIADAGQGDNYPGVAERPPGGLASQERGTVSACRFFTWTPRLRFVSLRKKAARRELRLPQKRIGCRYVADAGPAACALLLKTAGGKPLIIRPKKENRGKQTKGKKKKGRPSFAASRLQGKNEAGAKRCSPP